MKIIQELKINKPIFKKTAIRGHFGRNVLVFYGKFLRNWIIKFFVFEKKLFPFDKEELGEKILFEIYL